MTATTAEAPTETDALIDHILSRYHQTHRSELPGLIELAERVGTVHAGDPQSPKGLAEALTALGREMEEHMAKEEMILFPAMRAGGRPGIEHPLAVMRADHDDHAEGIEQIREMTDNLTPPDHACGSWRALYAGTDKFLDDLTAHVALENDVLFPRFEQG
ncbi:hemerythrin domain-containing protein [Sedimentitalea sp. JM2-8]|uniref:Hemerythrin domain-containing protein n=1 Tax=Sedimentitalea xiamensis TaxID=3050037 RepID=A0ABT7FET0_9RHOB|nr:hemerythrin domain-containing protein [Sedimentitalea xiamensis]MDK3073629.1 hemerythrin domain-containing protein [Sedimentitalea xiamensis]